MLLLLYKKTSESIYIIYNIRATNAYYNLVNIRERPTSITYYKVLPLMKGGIDMEVMAVGAYRTLCEDSPNKIQIDTWLTEGKSCMWISRQLKQQFGESISDKSVNKYKKYREEFLQKELENSPLYQNKMNMLNQQLVDGIGKIREVDIMGKLADIIDYSADLLADARDNDIQIRNAQDIRFTSQTLLDAIKIYGETVLQAQRFQKINEDPSLLKPQTININIKSALVEVLQSAMQDGDNGYAIIDKLRNGVTIIDAEPTDGSTNDAESGTGTIIDI